MDQALHERWQEGLARRLADTAQVVQPHINLVEGVIAREGTGFHRGRNRPLGLVIAGINMVAVDSIASYLGGFDPQRLVYLQMAAEAGLGTNDPSQLHIYTVQGRGIVPCRDAQRISLLCHPVQKGVAGAACGFFQGELLLLSHRRHIDALYGTG